MSQGRFGDTTLDDRNSNRSNTLRIIRSKRQKITAISIFFRLEGSLGTGKMEMALSYDEINPILLLKLLKSLNFSLKKKKVLTSVKTF